MWVQDVPEMRSYGRCSKGQDRGLKQSLPSEALQLCCCVSSLAQSWLGALCSQEHLYPEAGAPLLLLGRPSGHLWPRPVLLPRL